MISPTYTGPIYDPATAPGTTRTDKGKDTDPKQTFLRLLMTQVTNQNPLNPMDNTEFTQQLAMFSSLEQLINISKSMEAMNTMASSLQAAQAAGLIGKMATISSSSIPVTGGVVGRAYYTLEGPAQVVVRIFDSNGMVVNEYDLGMQKAGEHALEWDGTNAAGEKVPDGSYRVSIVATDSDGNPVQVDNIRVSALITGYKVGEDGKIYLTMGDTTIALDQVQAVEMPAVANTTAAIDQLSQLLSSSSTETQSTTSTDATTLLKALATLGALAGAIL